MQIVVLDGHALNPGDLSWNGLAALGPCTVYERTCRTAASRRTSPWPPSAARVRLLDAAVSNVRAFFGRFAGERGELAASSQ